MLSQIYGEFFANKYKIKINGKNTEVTGESLIFTVIKVSLNASIETNNPITEMTYQEKKIRLEELITKRRSNYTYAERTAEIDYLIKEREENSREAT